MGMKERERDVKKILSLVILYVIPPQHRIMSRNNDVMNTTSQRTWRYKKIKYTVNLIVTG